jgi:hypothetical protein
MHGIDGGGWISLGEACRLPYMEWRMSQTNGFLRRDAPTQIDASERQAESRFHTGLVTGRVAQADGEPVAAYPPGA